MLGSAARIPMGGEQRCDRNIRFDSSSFSTFRTESSRLSHELWNANEIASSCRQHEEPFDELSPAVTCLSQAANGFDPAERLFDPLTLDRADAIAGMTRGAGIDCRAAVGIVLR